MANLIALLSVSLHSDSSDPESDDGHDQAARGAVSSLQRRAAVAPPKEGREPEERSTELCGLGVGRGATTHDEASAVLVICHSGFVCRYGPRNRTLSSRRHGRKSEGTDTSSSF